MAIESAHGAAGRADGRRRWLRAAPAVAIVTLAAVLGFVLTRGTASPSAAYAISPTSWTLPALSGGGTVHLTDFRGKPLVLDFFASWCTACRSELPEFLSAQRQLGGRVQFAGVDSEENGDGLGLARSSGITSWRLMRDVGGTQQSGLREALEAIPGMPITAFYAPDGRLLRVRLGALSKDALLADIAQLYPATT